MKKFLWALFIAVCVGIPLYIVLHGSNVKTTRVVIETPDQKLYFWTPLDKKGIAYTLKNDGQVVQTWIKIICVDDEFYVFPEDADRVAHIFGHHFNLIPYDGGDFEGYAVNKAPKMTQVELVEKPTDKLGMKEYDQVITITQPDNHNTFTIRKGENPVNCEEKWIWVETNSFNGRSGKFHSLESYWLVNVQEMARALGYEVSLEYDTSDKVLFVRYEG